MELLPGQPVVSFQPAVMDLLGAEPIPDTLTQAILLHLLATNTDPSTGDTIMSAGEMSRRTGLPLTRVRRNLTILRRMTVLTAHRSGAFDSPYAWTVHPLALRTVALP